MANTFSPIQSVTLGSAAASVTFSGIPQTYTDLVLRVAARAGGSPASSWGFNLRCNGVSTTLYSVTILTGSGTAASSARLSDTMAYAGDISSSSATTNTFGSAEIYLPNYTGSADKPLSSFAAAETNASASNLRAVAGLARIAAAINSLTIIPDGTSPTNDFVAGSSFHLYGIKNT